MRRSVLSAVLAATLCLFACSEQPTEAPTTTAPSPGGPSSLVTCTATGIQAQIDALFPAGGLRTSAQAQFSSVPKAVDKESGTAARDKTIAIVDFLLTTYYAGQLTGGLSTATFDQVLDLIRSFYCFARLASPDLPSTTGGSDLVVVLVSPGDPTITVVTPSEHAAVTIPEGATPEPTLIAISLLPDDPLPLRTSLDQYPFFYHFSGTTATGPVTFNLDVTAGVCLRDNIDVPDANLRLAHNVGPLFGDVEILPRPASVPGLDCSDLGLAGGSGPIGSIGSWGESRFAWAKRLFLPTELHAVSVTLETLGVGGTTKKFSEFGVVDIFSNPGSFSPVGSTSTTEEGGSTVTRTVLVTSANGTPIPGVPVTFATGDGTLGTPQPVFTDASGHASASWTLPEEPGTYTLTADAPAEDNPPLETTDPPAGNVASNPDVAFDPTSLTFTATVLAPEVTISLAGPVTFLTQCEGDPSVCSEAFTQDGYELQSFWLDGETSEPVGAELQRINGHFHMVGATLFNGFEGHHWQGDFSRQGIRIRRADGGTFTLQSIEYRPRASFPGTPFEIGTSPITSIVIDETKTYVTLASGYTTFPAPAGDFTFQTVTFSGFEDVTEVYITMRGAADWRNIVLTQGP